MKLVFFGSGAFGLPTLERLARDHQLLAVVSQPDRPAGRGGAPTPTPIAAWSAEHLPAVPLVKPEKINEPGVSSNLRSFGADAWVVIAFGQKLGRALLEGNFAMNLHASLLPRWRGAAPINAAILAGDLFTGNSVITLADRMDAGEILGRSRREIGPEQTAGELHDLLAADGPALVESVLRSHEAGTLRREVQDESRATLASKLSKAEGWLDFSAGAESCRRRIHGLTPWPGVTATFRGSPLRLARSRVLPGVAEPASPGAILDPAQGLVACGPDEGGQSAALQVLEVHPAGRRQMSWAEFARGSRVAKGELLVGRGPQAQNASQGGTA